MNISRENYRYDECGLKYVTLVGIEITRCPKCGNYEITIPRIEELHQLLAKVLINPKKATATRVQVESRDEQWELVLA